MKSIKQWKQKAREMKRGILYTEKERELERKLRKEETTKEERELI